MSSENFNRTERLLEAIRQAQVSFILESGTAGAFRLLLDELLAITESEYGFIGETDEDQEGSFLRVRAYTDISWNEETRKLLADSAATGLMFRNMDTLFGHAILTEQVVIANDAPNHPASTGIPKGHPPLRSFLGIPIHYGQKLVGLIGLANCPNGYDQEIVDFLSPLISTCGLLAYSRSVAELKEHQLRNEEQSQRLVEFAQKLAHDLNNLLTVTLTTIDASLLTQPPKMGQEAIERIQLATMKAAELSEKIMTFAGDMAVNRRPCDVPTVFNEVEIICKAMMPKAISFEMNMSQGVPSVLADEVTLQQALTNMVFNSIEALDGNEGTIQLSARLLPQNKVALSVSDNGPGMSEATQNQAFDPYFTTKSGNRGFGLSSVRGLAKSHQAKLDLISEIGKGTTITIELSSAPVAADRPNAADESFQFTGSRIWIVDDNPAVRSSVASLLNCVGAKVVEFASGAEVLERMRERPMLDLLLSDVVMPGMSGIELAERLREEGIEVPIIFMTGQMTQPASDSITIEGASIFLRKPFKLGDLREACESVWKV
ncbi:MAG: response regulator [Planctomycetota bacterium]